MTSQPTADQLRHDWNSNPRWAGVTRPYAAEEVVRLRGTVAVEHSLARLGADKLWNSLQSEPFVNALGALTGNQAMQQVKAGLKAIYLSGWQVAADANLGGQMYPDQSLYPADSVPAVVKRINNTLLRADQIQHAEGKDDIDFLQPIVADAEAGFGGVLNAFELMKGMIESGAAGVHFEDQLASAKKCGHMGGKVLVPTAEAVQKLVAARLAADVAGVPTLIVARTDAMGAGLLTADTDEVVAALEEALEELSLARRERYFTRDANGYAVTQQIRQLIVFARHNVITDAPFTRLDLVSCRNLLIYLQPALQRRVLELFHYALRPAGWLFLGASETARFARRSASAPSSSGVDFATSTAMSSYAGTPSASTASVTCSAVP